MRVLILETASDGLLDLALRAQKTGHEVRYHCATYDPVKQPVGRGLVPRVAEWRPSMRWADLVVLGGNGKWLIELDRWRREGVPIIGGGVEAAKLELDRMTGMAAFRRKGVPVPPYRQCANLRDAIEYVVKRDEGFAVKPCGDVADKTTSIVGKTGRDTAWRLERWRKEGKAFPAGVIVQERIEGVEFAVGAWVGRNGFASGWEENFEEKKLFAGGLGPNCGEAGTVLRLVKASKLASKVLAPFEDYLSSLGYVGNVDVNCIVDDDGNPWPLEWTVRMGWPALNIELAMHDGDPVEFLAGLAAGKPPRSRRMDDIALGVVLAMPPYPFGHEQAGEVVNVPIWGITPAIEPHVHLCMAMEGQHPVIENGVLGTEKGLATAGSYVAVATGTGETVQMARERAYRVTGRIEIPNSPFYRIDIGQRLRRDLDRLQAHGYASGMRYA